MEARTAPVVSVGAIAATGSGSLLDRDLELEQLDRLIERAGAGSGGTVVIEGPAGIGKTELLGALAARAQQRGFAVLRARGGELEVSMAFGVARQLFEPLLRSAPTAGRRRLVTGAAHVGARAIGVGRGQAPADRFAALHGLYWLCANLAEREPVVVAVDDLQWVDEPSLAWLDYVRRRCGELRLLIAVTLREGDCHRDQASLDSFLAATVERIAPAPLSVASVGVLAAAALGAEAEAGFWAACHELTGGNPFYLRELLAAARAEVMRGVAEEVAALRSIVPVSVGTSVLARLTQMGHAEVALARAVAVLGSGVEVSEAAELAGLDLAEAELAADALAAGQIFAPARPLEFFHPLIGAAVYEDLGLGERRLAHRFAAGIVDRDGALGRVAAHLLATGPTGDWWVAARLADAAAEAAQRGAPDAAVAYLRRALDEPPAEAERGRLLLMLGEAEWRCRQAGAIEHPEQALAAITDVDASLAATMTLAYAYLSSDRTPEAVEVLERAWARAGAGRPEVALMLEGAIAGVGQWDERTAAGAGMRAERLRERVGALPEVPVGIAAAVAFYAAKSNRAVEAEGLVERALAGGRYPPPQDFANPLLNTLWLVERYETALRLCDDLEAVARRRGDATDLAEVAAWRARVLLCQGRLADAEAQARWALEHAAGSVSRLHAMVLTIESLLARGMTDAAQQELECFPDRFDSRFIIGAHCLFARGLVRAAQGQHEKGLADLLECGKRCRRLELSAPAGAPWRSEAALLHHALGQHEEARALARDELELARAFARPRTLGVALRASGLVEDADAGLELLREAVDALAGSSARLELARALTDYGALLRRAGRRVQARDALQQGLDVAHRCGAGGVARRARAELIAAGAKPRRDAITGRDALTPAELRVARLAAEGMTNRQIAQALFISGKTAEVHLGRVYRKVGIRSRGQLAGALAAEDPDAAATS